MFNRLSEDIQDNETKLKKNADIIDDDCIQIRIQGYAKTKIRSNNIGQPRHTHTHTHTHFIRLNKSYIIAQKLGKSYIVEEIFVKICF